MQDIKVLSAPKASRLHKRDAFLRTFMTKNEGEKLKNRFKKWLRVGMIAAFFTAALSVTVFAAGGNGTNQLFRYSWRLDSHSGTVVAGGQIPLYKNESCTRLATDAEGHTHYVCGGDWVIRDGECNPAVTYPITVNSHDTPDAGHSYAQYYMRASDWNVYVVDGTGSFSGDTWNENSWYNNLPSNISYTGQKSGGTIWVSNNIGFHVENNGYGYYKLVTNNGVTVDYATADPNNRCYYDSGDLTNADYIWHPSYQGSNAGNLHQGTNTVYYVGMDSFGNFLTGQRNLKWDTLAPIMATNLTALGEAHNGWFNLADFNSNKTYSIVSRDDTSETSDVSGLNTASLQTDFDGTNRFGNIYGYQAFNTFDGTNWVKSMSLRGTMQALGVQNDGTGGQGTHSYTFSSLDHALNMAIIGNIVRIDTIPPTCTASVGASDWHLGASPVTLTFSDNLSGVETQQYSWSQSQTTAGSWQTYTSGAKLVPPDSGVWYLHWKAVDVAGNPNSGVFGPYTKNADLAVKIQTPNAGYLTNEDVITSVYVSDNSETPIIPGDAALLSFTVRGPSGEVCVSQSKSVVCPAANNNLIWFRWHTPSSPGNYTMAASVTASNVAARSGWTNTLTWNIKVPTETIPSQTKLTDTRPSWFSVQTPNSCGYSSALSWDDWIYTYQWNGKFWYGVFEHHTYSATLNVALSVTPTKTANGSNRIVTATKNSSGEWVMKSGYGINESVTSGISLLSPTGSAIDGSSATSAQLTEGRYPEFDYYYAGYFRLFDSTGNGGFQLKVNPYSQYGFRAHYVPVWFPDGAYTALATVSQAWTPAGMLGHDATDTIQIQGALPNDWYVKSYS